MSDQGGLEWLCWGFPVVGDDGGDKDLGVGVGDGG